MVRLTKSWSDVTNIWIAVLILSWCFANASAQTPVQDQTQQLRQEIRAQQTSLEEQKRKLEQKQDEPVSTGATKAGSLTNTSDDAALPSTTATAPALAQSTAARPEVSAGLFLDRQQLLSRLREPRETVATHGLVDDAIVTQTGKGTAGPAPTGKISLLDTEPVLYHGMLRYPKFYGDPNMNRATIDGSFFKRQYLLGSLEGGRDTLAKHGLVINASLTQTGQGAATGSGDGARYFGSGDLWVALDTGRAGLWSRGLVYAHFEGDWSKTVTGTGALLPLNGDNIMPGPPSKLALSEFYLIQGLPSGFAVAAGKANWSAFADTSFFANNERTQFMYEGLINNAVLGAFVPYTALGVMLLKQVNPEVGLGLLVTTSNTKATEPGFDDICACSLTYGFAVNWTPKFGGLPGIYDALVGFNSKNVTSFDVDQHYLIGEIMGQVPIDQKGSNTALTLGGTQYLKLNKDARRSDGMPVGVGPFFRFGISPKDRNVIDQFYSLGVGGYGGFFSRFDDNWGVGWAGTHFSSDLRRDIAILGRQTDSFEHAVEAYYNFALTHAMKTSFHMQYINSANPSRDPALVLAIRLQVDF